MITPPYDRELLGEDGLAPPPGPELDELAPLDLRRYRPRSRLTVPTTEVGRSAVPAIDAHAHLGRWLTAGRWAVPDVGAFVAMLDVVNVDTVVNLDGMWDEELAANVARYDAAHPGRFVTCCQVDWSCLTGPDPEPALVDGLRRAVDDGARGLKVWKSLGLSVGTDGIAPTAESYALHFRFLETADEHFPYASADPPPTGRWRISGLDLEADALDRIYRTNAAERLGF